MAKNQELELSILIGGHVDNSLSQAVKSANTQIGNLANGASKLATNIAKVTVGITTGITAALADATKEAVKFESEMLDVTKYVGGKTVDGKFIAGLTDKNGKVIKENYDKMSKSILDLSTQIPYTAEELTRLAAAAGQSGKSMDDLISGGFLKDVAEMGTAMDISADQAGDWAAKWEVAFNMNHSQVMELADQINYLGAHYATTAAEIAQTVNDTGSMGQIAGMDVASTAALSTALLAMGVDTGKVATSIRRMYTNLSMGSKATDAQSVAFEQLGFTAEQFAKDMQKDAPAALKSLFSTIGNQPKDKQVGYLKTLLGQWAIESGAKLTGNLDMFVKTLDDVGDASKYNGSMYKEFMLKCETSESVLTMLGSAWRAVRIEVGNNFLPILKEVAGFGIDRLNDFRAALPDITARIKNVIDYLLNNGDKVAAALTGIGTAWAGMKFAPQIVQGISAVTKLSSGKFSPAGIVQSAVSGAQKAPGLWSAAKLGAQLANQNGSSIENTIIGGILGLQNSKKLSSAKSAAGMAKAVSGLLGGIQSAQTSGGLLGMLKGSSIGQYGARVAGAAKNFWGTNTIQTGVGIAKWIGQKAAGLGGLFAPAMQSAMNSPLGNLITGIGQSAIGLGKNALGGVKNIAGGAMNLASAAANSKAGKAVIGFGGNVLKGTGDAFKFLGAGANLVGTAVGPVAGKLGGAFMSLLGTFGPVITGIGGIIAAVSLLGDHFDDIRNIVGQVFGEKGLTLFDGFTQKVSGIGGKIGETISNAFSLENLQNIQQSLSGKSIFGIDDLGTTFGAVIPIIESVKNLVGQIVDLGVNHIKPLLADVMSFVVNELFPAVSPLISAIISLVGTTLINAIKLVVDVIHGLLPVIEPIIQTIVKLVKGIVTVVVNVVNGIIRALNGFSFTVPQWLENVPVAKAFAGQTFGFNLKEVAMPQFANGGFTHGASIAGEAGTEAVISFRPSAHGSNVENWIKAGRMLGVSSEEAGLAAGLKAYGNYALHSNGVNTMGDAVSLLWTLANNSMSGDGTLALMAAGIAEDLTRLVLNKYRGGSGRTLSSIPQAAYAGGAAGNSNGNGNTPIQFVFSPNVTIPSDADRQTVSNMMMEEYEKFKKFMAQYLHETERTSYR